MLRRGLQLLAKHRLSRSPIPSQTTAMDPTEPAPENPPAYIAAARKHGIPLRQSAPIRRGPMPLQLPILDHLRTKRVILASASPRRRALLNQLGLTDVEVFPSDKPEDVEKGKITPEEYVAETARRKVLHVYEQALKQQEEDERNKVPEKSADPALVISADTIIATRSGRILEKPRDEQDHIRMLKHLRDTRVHRVLTAVCVLAPKDNAAHPGYELETHVEDTEVYFAQVRDGLPDDVIEAYVKTREGADKAGGYAIQGIGGMVLVDKIEGSVDNVIGLPVRKTLQLAEKVIFRQGMDDDEEEDAGSDEEED